MIGGSRTVVSSPDRAPLSRLQTVARLRPRSATCQTGMRPPCVLDVLGFRTADRHSVRGGDH